MMTKTPESMRGEIRLHINFTKQRDKTSVAINLGPEPGVPPEIGQQMVLGVALSHVSRIVAELLKNERINPIAKKARIHARVSKQHLVINQGNQSDAFSLKTSESRVVDIISVDAASLFHARGKKGTTATGHLRPCLHSYQVPRLVLLRLNSRTQRIEGLGCGRDRPKILVFSGSITKRDRQPRLRRVRASSVF